MAEQYDTGEWLSAVFVLEIALSGFRPTSCGVRLLMTQSRH
jgi:hypothetical protein